MASISPRVSAGVQDLEMGVPTDIESGGFSWLLNSLSFIMPEQTPRPTIVVPRRPIHVPYTLAREAPLSSVEVV